MNHLPYVLPCRAARDELVDGSGWESNPLANHKTALPSTGTTFLSVVRANLYSNLYILWGYSFCICSGFSFSWRFLRRS